MNIVAEETVQVEILHRVRGDLQVSRLNGNGAIRGEDGLNRIRARPSNDPDDNDGSNQRESESDEPDVQADIRTSEDTVADQTAAK